MKHTTISDLRDHITTLEEALGMTLKWPAQWRLRPIEQRMLGVLVQRREVSRETMLAAMYGAVGLDEPDSDTLGVHLCYLRRKLKPLGVTFETIYGWGFFMSKEMVEKVRHLTEYMHEEN